MFHVRLLHRLQKYVQKRKLKLCAAEQEQLLPCFRYFALRKRQREEFWENERKKRETERERKKRATNLRLTMH